MFCDPLFFILLVNILALVWAVRSWRKTIQEKWMNNLRDSAADIIGSSELIYGLDGNDPASQLPVAKAEFIAREQKLLLLFREGSSTHSTFKLASEELRSAAEARQVEPYRKKLNKFSGLVSRRLLEEWEKISTWY